MNDSATDPITLFLIWYEEARTGMGGTLAKHRVMSWGAQALRRSGVSFLPFLPWSDLLRAGHCYFGNHNT